MATSYNTGIPWSASNAASAAGTIPSGVLTGDTMWLGFTIFCEAATAPAITLTGGGATWTAPAPSAGSNPEQATTGTLYAYGYLYTAQATASDPGATLTITETGSPAGTTWISAALVTYTGAGSMQPDVIVSAAANDVLSVAAPAVNTGRAGDWYLGFQLGGTNGAPTSGPPGTQRQAVTSGAGVTAVVWDSNGTVGPAGTSIGGGTVHGGNSAPNNTFTVFTIGMAPAAARSIAGADISLGAGCVIGIDQQ
jgi:hypothetical protein